MGKKQRTAVPKRTKHPSRAGVIPAITTRALSLLAVVMIVVFVALWQFWPSPDSKEQAEPIASLNAPDFHSLLLDATNPDRLLFGSHAGIQESNDGGFTWSQGGLSNQDAMQLTSSPTAPLTVYATGHDVFQVSFDGGITWQPQSHNLPGTDIHGFAQDRA